MTPYLLIATPEMLDPNFRETVVLVVEHSETGALGFVLNRPRQVELHHLLRSEITIRPEGIQAWSGGPVSPQTGIVIHHCSPAHGDSMISEGLALSSFESSLKRFFTNHDAAGGIDEAEKPRVMYPWRFLTGYAGWGAGQLDNETGLGHWLKIPFDSKLVANTAWEDLWSVAYAMWTGSSEGAMNIKLASMSGKLVMPPSGILH